MRGFVASGVAALALASGGSVALAGPHLVAPCPGTALAASFSVVPGSAGAGNIVYVLRVRNRTSATCWVSGMPRLLLFGRTGVALPTHPRPLHPGGKTAVRVVLKPGAYASVSARFSPDVPGVGEPVLRACEPIAYRLRVTPQPGRSWTRAPIAPPTRVCEHGGMTISGFVAGKNGAIPG